MSHIPFSDCPVKELPAIREVFQEIYHSIFRLDGLYARAELLIDLLERLINDNEKFLEISLKYRNGFLEEVLRAADAVSDFDQRVDIHQKLADMLTNNAHHDEQDGVWEIIGQFGMPEVLDPVLAWQLRPTFGFQEERFKKLFPLITPSSESQQRLLARFLPLEADSENWESVIEKARKIEDGLLRAEILTEIVSCNFLKDHNFAPQKLALVKEIERILEVIFSEQGEYTSLRVARWNLADLYTDLGMYEDASRLLLTTESPSSGKLRLHRLIKTILDSRGGKAAANQLQTLSESVNGMSFREGGLFLVCLMNIAADLGCPELQELFSHKVHEHVQRHPSNSLQDTKDQCQIMIGLGYYYSHIKDDSNAVLTFQKASQMADSINDEDRIGHITKAALGMAECDYFHEALDVFRQYQSDLSFVLSFYETVQYEIREFYLYLSDEDKEAWGFAQQESWLKFIYHNIGHVNESVKRIQLLQDYLGDLDDHYRLKQECRERATIEKMRQARHFAKK